MSIETLMAVLAVPALLVVIPSAPFAPLLGLCGFLGLVYIRPQDHVAFLAQLPLAKVLGSLTLVGMFVYRGKKGEAAEPLMRGVQDWALLGLLLAVMLSMLNSVAPEASTEALGEFVKVILVYLLIGQVVDSERRLYRFFWFVTLLHTAVAAIYVYMYKTGFGTSGRVWGLQEGFLGNPDDAGVAFVVGMALLLTAFFAKRKGAVATVSLGAMLLVDFVAGLVTKSRGTLLGMFVVIGVVLLLNLRRSRVSLAAWGVMAAVALYGAYRFRWTVMELWSAIDPNTATALSRMDTWETGLQMFSQNPIFGVGIGSYTAHWRQFFLPGERMGMIQVAHNVLLEVAAQTGVLGLVFYLLFIGAIVHTIWRARSRLRSADDRDSSFLLVAEAVLAALAGFLVNGMFITVGFYWHLYLLGGIAAALRNVLGDEAAREAAPLAGRDAAALGRVEPGVDLGALG